MTEAQTCSKAEDPPDPVNVPLCPKRLILFCTNLFIGLILSQLIPVWMDVDTYSTWKHVIKVITMVCVSFIMIHVGFHFDIDKTEVRQYGKEYLVAMTAAGFPWLLCAFWFMFALGEAHNMKWQEALIAARFAAPTSAGILFTMLEAAGMKGTWLFQKARILAIFDDIDTLLLMVPLKAFYVGLKWELSIDLVFVCILLLLMWNLMHKLKVPITWPWIILYAACIAVFCEFVHFLSSSEDTDPNAAVDTLHLEVLLPAFTVGCMLDGHAAHDEHSLEKPQSHGHGVSFYVDKISPDKVKATISAVFMVLVGFSMPALFTSKHDEADAHRRLGESSSEKNMPAGEIVLHVMACTFLMNLGKLFPATCYRNEVNLKSRVALAVAMMPRGEVCAGIIVNALALGIDGPAMTVAVFCLACNMMMVSGFIFVVRTLTKESEPAPASASASTDGAKEKSALGLPDDRAEPVSI